MVYINILSITEDDFRTLKSLEDVIGSFVGFVSIFDSVVIRVEFLDAEFLYENRGCGKHYVVLKQKGITIGYCNYEVLDDNRLSIKSFSYPLSNKILRRAGFSSKEHQLSKLNDCAETTHFTLNYLSYLTYNRDITYVIGSVSVGSSGSINSTSSSISNNIIRLSDVVIRSKSCGYTKKILKDSWGVRGHYRTLKDGRKIFVRPYKKGLNKDKECFNYYGI